MKAQGLWLRGTLLWVLFKLLQAVVAAAFSLVIVAQAGAAGIVRLFGEPAALLRVQAAQLASVNSSAAANVERSDADSKGVKRTTAIKLRAVATDASAVKPIHVFNDPSKGELVLLELCMNMPCCSGGATGKTQQQCKRYQ